MSARKFVKVYRELPNEYPAIYDDADTLGTYVQLLMLVDGMYETHPQLPRVVADGPLEQLVTAGLVILEDHDRYTIKGYDKMRQAESEQGRRDARRRWGDDRADRPNGVPNGTPYATRPDQTRQDQSKTRAPAPEGGGAPREQGTANGMSPYLRIDTGGTEGISEAVTSGATGSTSPLKDLLSQNADGTYEYQPPEVTE